MYTRERTDWWAQRSRMPDHQRAYELVAAYLGRGRVTIDHCCGNAELLKRVYQAYIKRNPQAFAKENAPLLIGTDLVPETLEVASENLRRAGIESVIINDVSDIAKRSGVVFIQDDLSQSRLPQELSDNSVFMFAELTYRLDTPRVREIMDADPNSDSLTVRAKIITRTLSAVTKVRGSVVICDYAMSKGGDSSMDRKLLKQEREVAEDSGLHLTFAPFTMSQEVWEDIGEEERLNLAKPNTKKGYRTLIYNKLR